MSRIAFLPLTSSLLLAGLLPAAGSLSCARVDASRAVRAGEPRQSALETRPEETLLQVPLDAEVRRIVTLANPTGFDVVLKKGRSSCSCVTLENQDQEASLVAGSTLELPLRIHSTRSGLKHERLLFLASRGAEEPELVEVPISLLTGAPIYTEPAALHFAGPPRARIADAFTVAAYLTGAEDARLRWSADEAVLLAPSEPSRTPLSTGEVEETSFALTIPDLAPGSYTFPVEFWREDADDEEGRVRRSLSLLITR